MSEFLDLNGHIVSLDDVRYIEKRHTVLVIFFKSTINSLTIHYDSSEELEKEYRDLVQWLKR